MLFGDALSTLCSNGFLCLYFRANMKLGVNVGMVRSKLSCQSGSDALKQNYIDVLGMVP